MARLKTASKMRKNENKESEWKWSEKNDIIVVQKQAH